MVRSYLISYLATRAAVLGPEFGKKHPGAWLVWEPGVWHAPEAGGASSRKTIAGFIPSKTPSGSDALCFQLVPDAKQTSWKLGRDEKCDLVISDATVSREHLVVSAAPNGGWLVQAAADRAVKKDGTPLAAGTPVPLPTGSKLELGSVTLTFLDGPAFESRLWGAKK